MTPDRDFGRFKSALLRFCNGFAKFKPAFTLSEVLITLGIIGVVAAMTIPTLMSSIQNKQLEVGLKNAYATLAQALKMYQQENGYPLIPSNVGLLQLKPILMKYIKNVKDCGRGHGDSHRACMPKLSQVQNPENYEFYMNYDGTSIGTDNLYILLDDGQFVINNGMLVLLENDGSRNVHISVDVNGYKKKPNRLGHDLFMFQLMDDGQLLPMGANNTRYNNISTYCSDTSTDLLNGAGCTYKALYDKNYFKNLPK